MAPSVPHERRLCNVTLLCVLLAATAAQSCAAANPHRSAMQPHARKRLHARTTQKAGPKHPHVKPRAKPHKTPPHKAVPRSVPAARKPMVKPAAEQKRVTAPSAAAAGAQLTVRTCGTPPQNQTTRVAVHSALQRRMEQRAQSRSAPITVRVFFAIIQASCSWFHPAMGFARACTKLERADVISTMSTAHEPQQYWATTLPIAMSMLPQKGTTAQDGYVSDQQIAAQMSVLNSAFSGVQVIFVLAGVQRITNHPEWWCVPQRSDPVLQDPVVCTSRSLGVSGAAPRMWSPGTSIDLRSCIQERQ